ncbi:glycosyltransferase [Candidatus Woesearchaeota archaeon]|nr:glycosyltransferase [Candidatus Woesearchaeota archaeon]
MEKSKLFISSVIAAYNEKGNVERLFLKIDQVMKRMNVEFEIIAMIDGNDGSYESLLKLKKEKHLYELKLYHNPKPCGLGNAFRKGFNLVNEKATHILTMDADWNHDPEEIPRLLSTLQQTNIGIVVGSRRCKGGRTYGIPLWKRFVSISTNMFFNILTNVQVKDKTSGFRLYTKEANDIIKNKFLAKHFDFLPEILIIAQKNGIKIKESPIQFKYRTIGKSKLGLFDTSRGYLKLLYNLFTRKYDVKN